MFNYVLYLAIGAFLGLNIFFRSYALHCQAVPVRTAFCVAGVVLFLVWRFPRLLKSLCFAFGFSLPLFGFQSYTLQNQFFEYWVVLLTGFFLLACLHDVRSLRGSGYMEWIFAGYILLAFSSLQLFPVGSFIETLRLWGGLDMSNLMFAATPENPLYGVAAVNRLVLFYVFILLLNRLTFADLLYRRLFSGIVLSVFVACLLGFGNQLGVYSLEWYRPQFVDLLGAGQRLQSVFGNPGWFAEYVTICSPLLLLFCCRSGGVIRRVLVLSIYLVFICTALFLTGSRTSWIVFVAVVMCCFFVVFLMASGKEGEAITWRHFREASFSMGIVVLGVCLIIGSSVLFVKKSDDTGSQNASISRAEYLLQRIRTVTTLGERAKIWQESLALVAESPIYGLGYEGYRWHQEVMDTIPESRFAQERQTTTNWDTSHNFYIQLVTGNGLVGMLIWAVLIGYTGLVFFLEGIARRNVQCFALLIALFAFHSYGLAQSMQYVASIWLLVFLLIGYAGRVRSHLDVSWLIWIELVGTIVVGIALVIGVFAYYENRQSRLLAERYGGAEYGGKGSSIRYKGFYPRENWGSEGLFRWSGKAAEIEFLKRSGTIQITFVCHAPSLEQLPIMLSISLDGQVIDQYTFRQGGKVTKKYFIPAGDDMLPVVLGVHPSRTWNPKRERINADPRNLGIAVGEPSFIPVVPVIPILLFQ